MNNNHQQDIGKLVYYKDNQDKHGIGIVKGIESYQDKTFAIVEWVWSNSEGSSMDSHTGWGKRLNYNQFTKDDLVAKDFKDISRVWEWTFLVDMKIGKSGSRKPVKQKKEKKIKKIPSFNCSKFVK